MNFHKRENVLEDDSFSNFDDLDELDDSNIDDLVDNISDNLDNVYQRKPRRWTTVEDVDKTLEEDEDDDEDDDFNNELVDDLIKNFGDGGRSDNDSVDGDVDSISGGGELEESQILEDVFFVKA